MEITENQEFKDISKTGKDRKWKERKLQNIEYAKRLEILGYKAFANAYQCAEVLSYETKIIFDTIKNRSSFLHYFLLSLQ